MERSLVGVVLLALFAGPATAQETGRGLGTPPQEGNPTPVDPAVITPAGTPPIADPNSQTPAASNDEIPPPPPTGYTTPSGYGQPPPRFVDTRPQFRLSAPARRRVRVRVRENTQIPADARVFERRSRFLLVPGLIAFSVGYALSVSLGVADDDPVLYAPILGPILWQLDDGTSDTAGLMALLTVAQTAGLILFAFGMRKKTYAEWYAGGRRIALAAAPSRHGAGVTLNVW